MNHVTNLYGPPGTGKTRWLLDRLEEELARGVSPDRVAFIAFTRKAAHEAQARVVERFGLGEGAMPWCRTLHSACYKAAKLKPDDVMATADYQRLGAALGSVRFEHEYGEHDPPRPGGALGDRLTAVVGLAHALELSLEAAHRLADPGTSLTKLREFARWLAAYKRDTGKLDFSDMLDAATEPLDVDVLLVDEAQDLTPRQWRTIYRLGGRAERAYVAGDDDQWIFGWAGARLEPWRALRADRIVVLDRSWRVPAVVQGLAQQALRWVHDRVPKVWAPRPGGTLRYRNLGAVDLRAPGTWYLLARNRCYLDRLRQLAEDAGLPYVSGGRSSLEDGSVRAVLVYERLRRGRRVDRGELVPLLKRCDARLIDPEDLSPDVAWGDVSWPWAERAPWTELYETGRLRVPERQAYYLRRLRRFGESLTQAPRATIATIHEVKGGEADHVLLLPDLTYRTDRGRLADPAAEARVWYVGATRAKGSLTIAEPLGQRYYRI